jgi:hypothetical protein
VEQRPGTHKLKNIPHRFPVNFAAYSPISDLLQAIPS